MLESCSIPLHELSPTAQLLLLPSPIASARIGANTYGFVSNRTEAKLTKLPVLSSAQVRARKEIWFQ